MGTSRDVVDHILAGLTPAHDIRAHKMFGEYCVYFGDKMVALVCDDQLFIKPTAAGRASIESHLGEPEESPPYPGARPCFVIPEERWADAAWLGDLLRITADELPAPRKRTKMKAAQRHPKKKNR